MKDDDPEAIRKTIVESVASDIRARLFCVPLDFEDEDAARGRLLRADDEEIASAHAREIARKEGIDVDDLVARELAERIVKRLLPNSLNVTSRRRERVWLAWRFVQAVVAGVLEAHKHRFDRPESKRSAILAAIVAERFRASIEEDVSGGAFKQRAEDFREEWTRNLERQWSFDQRLARVVDAIVELTRVRSFTDHGLSSESAETYSIEIVAKFIEPLIKGNSMEAIAKRARRRAISSTSFEAGLKVEFARLGIGRPARVRGPIAIFTKPPSTGDLLAAHERLVGEPAAVDPDKTTPSICPAAPKKPDLP